MSDVEIKLSELKKNSRMFIIGSSLVGISMIFLYYSVLSGNGSSYLTSKYIEASVIFKYSLASIYFLGLASYTTGVVFYSLSLYISENFYGESEFKESRNVSSYTKKRHMFKAGLISSIVFFSSLIIINVLLLIMVFI